MCDTLSHLGESNSVLELLENVKADIGVDGCVEEKWGQLCRYMKERNTLPLSVDGGSPGEWNEDLQQPTHVFCELMCSNR